MESLTPAAKKLYLAIKYHPDHANRPLVEALCMAFERCGWQIVVVARDLEGWGAQTFSPQALMARSFRLIDACAGLVVEISEKGVGVGIEAGYAHARGLPILTLLGPQADLPETLKGISGRVVRYTPADLQGDVSGWLDGFWI